MVKEVDTNGFWLCRGCKITKAGVFPYLNEKIGIPDKKPDDIVYIYRPLEEIFNPDLLEAFNNRPLPLVNDHTMIGEGFTAPEEKGIDGVLTNVHKSIVDNSIKGDLTIYSEKMQDDINNGKKELSLGYRCNYEFESGVYNGKHYDAIQRDIRPNHIALVQRGRSGSDVRVLDHALCFDSIEMELTMKQLDTSAKKARLLELFQKATKKAGTSEDSLEEFKDLLNSLALDEGEEAKKDDDKPTEAKDEEEPKDKASDEEEKKTEDKCGTKDSEEEGEKKSEDEEEPKEEEKKAEDADDVIALLRKEIAELKEAQDELPKALREDMKAASDLAKSLSKYVGTFDSSDMTSDEVAKYGCEKLGIEIAKGYEKAALAGFFKASAKQATFSMDGSLEKRKKELSAIEKYKRG